VVEAVGGIKERHHIITEWLVGRIDEAVGQALPDDRPYRPAGRLFRGQSLHAMLH
jgi:hypothetical protein